MSTGTPVMPPLPSSVRLEAGRGGLPCLQVDGPAGQAEVYLQGAHVAAWRPTGHDPVIWMSQRSAFAPGTPIRGGIPVCFPWFGPGPTPEAGLHGFARTAEWMVVAVVESGEDVVLTLALTDAGIADTSPWPHPFAARMVITVGATLTMSLTVTNTGDEAVTFQEALHTYLSVGDVREASIRGLEDLPFTDRLGPGDQPASGEPLRITGETDRVYPQPGTILVEDPALGRTISVIASGSGNAVIWNPWVAKAAAMPDFGDDEWRDMVCVETCNVLGHAVCLEPRATSTMTARYEIAGVPAQVQG